MRNSLSLYLNRFSTKKSAGADGPLYQDYTDPVVWVAAQDLASVRAFINISKKLDQAGLNVTLLITGAKDLINRFNPEPGICFSTPPAETAKDCAAFISHWKPIIGFWAGGALAPVLIHAAAQAHVPMVLLNATENIKPEGAGFFQSKAINQSLRSFRMVFANNFVAGGICVRLGVAERAVEVSGPLSEGSVILPADDNDLDKLSQSLRGREIWFASNVPDAELDHVLAAHDALRGTNRRLLLVLNPADPSQSETLAIALADKGWRAAIRSKADELKGQTQIYLADKPDELGLWYRLAPISYLGGTLVDGERGKDPLEAAALGSAIVHGPRTGIHKDVFSQLHSANPPAATQIVTPDNLARAVAELLSPDVAAAQANSAWELVSRGAELTDRLMELIQEAFEIAEAEDA